jgi:hypothetical protein
MVPPPHKRELIKTNKQIKETRNEATPDKSGQFVDGAGTALDAAKSLNYHLAWRRKLSEKFELTRLRDKSLL